MTAVKVVVSEDGHGGTFDNVAMKFTNGRGEVCFTNHSSVYLSDVQTFTGGSTVLVDAERSSKEKSALGDCATGTFRPDEGLHVEVLINTASYNFWYDGYTFRQGFYIVQVNISSDEFSSIEVTFGDLEKYRVEGASCDGCGYEEGWGGHNVGPELTMTKVA